MKAIVCTHYGPPEALACREIETPTPRPNEVRIKIHATAVTSADARVRSFRVPLSFWLPARLALGLRRPRQAILGGAFAGDIEGVGKGVRLFKEGDPVLAYTGHEFGAYAEYRCMSETGCLTLKPAQVSYEEAAAIPFGGTTALHFLKEGTIKSGQKVLIYGASGSVGTFAVQLAKYCGADVTGVCSAAHVNLIAALGADRVIDYTTEDVTRSAETFDVIFDTVGKGPFGGCMRSLKAEGTYLQAVATPALAARMRWISLTSGKTLIGGRAYPRADYLVCLKDLVAAGTIRPVIDRVYPLAHIVDAHRYVDSGHKAGDVVITMC